MRTTLKKDEKILLITRQHWLRLVLPCFAWLLLTVLLIWWLNNTTAWIIILIAALYPLFEYINWRHNLWSVTNLRIIDATANRMGLPKEKVMINIQKYGNTTAGTLPLCLWEWESKLKKGDNILLTAFGGGFTWGTTYLKWAY